MQLRSGAAKHILNNNNKIPSRDFPGNPVVKTPSFSAEVWSLVRELGSHSPIPCGMAKVGKKNTVHYFESVEGKKRGYFSSLEDKKRGRVKKKEHGTEALNMVHIHSKINLIYYILNYYWGMWDWI